MFSDIQGVILFNTQSLDVEFNYNIAGVSGSVPPSYLLARMLKDNVFDLGSVVIRRVYVEDDNKIEDTVRYEGLTGTARVIAGENELVLSHAIMHAIEPKVMILSSIPGREVKLYNTVLFKYMVNVALGLHYVSRLVSHVLFSLKTVLGDARTPELNGYISRLQQIRKTSTRIRGRLVKGSTSMLRDDFVRLWYWIAYAVGLNPGIHCIGQCDADTFNKVVSDVAMIMRSKVLGWRA